jgi:hypothetical protein
VGAAGVAAVVTAGVIDVATIASGVSKGYEAAQAGDVQTGLNTQRDTLNSMLTLPPGLKELGGIFFTEQQKQINAVNAAKDAQTTAIETMRGNMVTATRNAADRSVSAAERTKGAIWDSKSAIVGAGQADRRAIQGTIRNSRPVVTVVNRISVSATNYVTATNITRMTRQGIFG